MNVSVIGSGSKGNAVFVESNSSSLLIDCGFSGKELRRRMELIGRSPENLSGLCVTHEHNDHIHGVGVLSRRYNIPVYGNPDTLLAGGKKMGKLYKSMEFETGERFEINGLEVQSFRVSHDTVDPVGFVVSDGTVRIGYCTDTGKISHLIANRLQDCNALVIEFNHDLEMLKNGPYPLPLQQRVRSSQGHLSNNDAAAFLKTLETDNLHLVIQAHLSETNNSALLASEALQSEVGEWDGVKRVVAHQDQPTQLFQVSASGVG